ncbi:MAG TPA: MBL fold metallo-hydrolase, partial [candidate division Zixibacteria bacterium]|nr:MBL fold metallo-hydrolase [candidate division Zixibacteria bacterium]
MQVQTLVVGAFQVNCYLYWGDAAGRGVIIDPGDEEERIADAVTKAGFEPAAVLLTHGHGDHIAAVSPLMKQYGIPLWAGAGEEKLLANPTANISALVGRPVTTPVPDKLLRDNEVVSAGPFDLRVLATPGHSPGGVCYLDERAGVLFTGDTLFWGSIGRT